MRASIWDWFHLASIMWLRKHALVSRICSQVRSVSGIIFPGCDSAKTGLSVRVPPVELYGEIP